MRLDPDNHVEIAGRAAVRAGVALACEADALPIARSGLDAYFHRFGAAHRPLAVAGRADRKILARALATRTLHIEFHASAGLRNLSRAIALGTLSWRFDVSLPVAGCANILPRDVEPHHAAANGRPERHVYLILKVGPRFRSSLSGRSPSASKDSRENVAKSAAATASPAAASAIREIRKVEAAEVKGHALSRLPCCSTRKSSRCAASSGKTSLPTATRISLRCRGINIVGIEADLIVDFSLLGIAQDIVGFGERLELLLRRLVPRINIRMVFARQLAKSLANLLRRRGFLHAQDLVIIFFGSRCHLR